jgi:hypothetical protein
MKLEAATGFRTLRGDASRMTRNFAPGPISPVRRRASLLGTVVTELTSDTAPRALSHSIRLGPFSRYSKDAHFYAEAMEPTAPSRDLCNSQPQGCQTTLTKFLRWIMPCRLSGAIMEKIMETSHPVSGLGTGFSEKVTENCFHWNVAVTIWRDTADFNPCRSSHSASDHLKRSRRSLSQYPCGGSSMDSFTQRFRRATSETPSVAAA